MSRRPWDGKDCERSPESNMVPDEVSKIRTGDRMAGWNKVASCSIAVLFSISSQGETSPSIQPRGVEPPLSLNITSTPSPARVHLRGKYIVTGTTPFTMSGLKSGTYHLSVSKKGYESYHKKVTFLPRQMYQISPILKRRTPLKATMRSVLFPGWGQLYSEKKTRGILFVSTEISLLSGWLFTHLWYEAARDDYKNLKERYEQAPHVKEKEILFNRMLDRLDDAEDWDRWRDGFFWAAAVFWAYNILDAILFFPRGIEKPVHETAHSGIPKFSAGSLKGYPVLKIHIWF